MNDSISTLFTKKPKRYALMIDLETLSTRPTAFVTQIGWVLYDFDKRETLIHGTYGVHADGQEHAHICPSTLKWWSEQSKQAQDAVFGDTYPTIHPTHLFDHLQGIIQLYDPLVWAAPAMFDLPILTNLFHVKPWSYSNERCFRTVRAILDPDYRLAPSFEGTPHNAADDAANQIAYLVALQELVGPGVPLNI